MDRSKFTDAQLKVIDAAVAYWGTELEKVTHKTEDKYEELLRKRLSKVYIQTGARIRKLLQDTLVEMADAGGLTAMQLYQANRYKNLFAAINRELVALGQKELEILLPELASAYEEEFEKIQEKFEYDGTFEMPNKKAIEKIVMMKWADRTISDSIWNNKKRVLARLQEHLLEAVVTGKSRTKIVSEMMQQFDKSYSDVNRLVRTELMNVLRNANDEVADQAGYKYKQWLTAEDERVCKFCRSLEDEVFPINSLPLSHPNCRCTFIYLKSYPRAA